MFRTVQKHWLQRRLSRRKRFVLREIRRQFESCGYSVAEISDCDLETAAASVGRPIEKSMPLTAKRTYWILRRLSPDVTQLRRQTEKSGKSEHQ